MEIGQNDPVDLLLMGKLEEAIEAYVTLYAEALEEGDHNIGRDLVTQLHHCIAAKYGDRAPEIVGEEVEQRIIQELREHEGLQYERKIITDDIAVAKEALRRARNRAEKSAERVEKEKEMRWKEMQ